MDLYAKSANKTTTTATTTSSSSNEHIVTPACITTSSSSSGAAGGAATTTIERLADQPSLLNGVNKPANQLLSEKNGISNTGNGKRKRRASTKDPELGFEPPSAKRQQRLYTFCGGDQSNESSVSSSLFTSPVTSSGDAASTQELISIRSSPAEELSQAPHSPLPDSPDSPPSPDRGAKQQPVVVRYGAGDQATANASANELEDEEVLDDSSEDYSFDEVDDEDENEEINSSSSSPTSSTATGCSQKGERTPATQQHQKLNNDSRPIGKDSLNRLGVLDEIPGINWMSPADESTLRQESTLSQCPLPALSWANADDVWDAMCKRDEQDARLRGSSMLDQHPGLQPRMRAILLDWLNEVCEVYKLHRETFHLAVDYLDRYLKRAQQVQKTHLQLIGITCLFVAAKVEEIYPPKICEFAYVTDGACTEKDILMHEKLLLQALDWDICPITVTGWLGVYMQLNINNRTPNSLSKIGKQAMGINSVDDAFIYPQFSGYEFVQTSQLLDLCALDVGMANYKYSVLAAAAISHTFNRETAVRCSGMDWQKVQACARWMEPFFQVISKKAPFLHLNEQNEQVTNKFGLAHICPNIVTDDSHIIQTHTTTMDMYDELLMTQNALHAMRARTHASPATALRAPESLLTPPASSQKPDDYLGYEDEVSAVVSATATATATATAAADSAMKATAISNNSSSTRLPLQQLDKKQPQQQQQRQQ